MCGKDIALPVITPSFIGSPPHVRERPGRSKEIIDQWRITPACAGKTSIINSSPTSMRDHPCMCGKDYFCLVQLIMGLGSPPHVRERQTQKQLKLLNNRITPACAGKTDESCGRKLWSRDHPRMCGKDCSKSIAVKLEKGSPPHVRERRS